MMTSAFLSTLSLSAEQNWAQNSGAKRRDDINCLIMSGSFEGSVPSNLGFASAVVYIASGKTGDTQRNVNEPTLGPLAAQPLLGPRLSKRLVQDGHDDSSRWNGCW